MNLSVARSVVSALMTVSTIRIQEGREISYETTIKMGAEVLDGWKDAKRGAALVSHDKVCDIARAWEHAGITNLDKGDARAAFFAAGLAAVGSRGSRRRSR